MSTMITGTISKALMPGVNVWFGQSYNELPMEYSEIFKTHKSTKYFEEDVGLAGLGLAVVKPETENISYGSMQQGFIKRYQHVTYGLGFIISREAIEDNQYREVAEMRTRALGRSMRHTIEHLGANVLNRAFDSNYTGADGLELCSAAHLFAKGGTFANELATAADLSEASLEQMCIDIMDMKDDAGLRIGLMPRKLVLPKELTFEAERILRSNLRSEDSSNALNALKSKGILPEGYVVNRRLTDTDAFFILTDCPDGLKHFERRGVEISNDTDFSSENMRFKATMRLCFGWTDPRGIFGSPGA